MPAFQTGTIPILTIQRKIAEGFILTDGREEVLLPEDEADDSLEEGQELEVFLYRNKKDQLLATRSIPESRIDAYGWAEVMEVVPGLGVFVDIGIPKEVLVSIDDLPLLKNVWPREGDWLFVSLKTDKQGRLLAKPVTEEDVRQDLVKAPASALKQLVTGRIYRAARAGSFLLTEEGYRGFIHPTERKTEPRLGETVTGRVIDVKADGTINVSLLPLKQAGIEEDAAAILEYLERHEGKMPFHDKSDPEKIRETFQISKAAFKRALGKLMKEKKVVQDESGTSLKPFHNQEGTNAGE